MCRVCIFIWALLLLVNLHVQPGGIVRVQQPPFLVSEIAADVLAPTSPHKEDMPSDGAVCEAWGVAWDWGGVVVYSYIHKCI